jgi:hypothetical protein
MWPKVLQPKLSFIAWFRSPKDFGLLGFFDASQLLVKEFAAK